MTLSNTLETTSEAQPTHGPIYEAINNFTKRVAGILVSPFTFNPDDFMPRHQQTTSNDTNAQGGGEAQLSQVQRSLEKHRIEEDARKTAAKRL